jgi:hypothetical protein
MDQIITHHEPESFTPNTIGKPLRPPSPEDEQDNGSRPNQEVIVLPQYQLRDANERAAIERFKRKRQSNGMVDRVGAKWP